VRVGALQAGAGNRAVSGLVQRRLTSTFLANVTTPYQPARDRLLGQFTLGYTPPVLNGNRIEERGGVAAAQAALNRPTLDARQPKPDTYEARVAAVPVNTVSSDQELMVAPPWTANGTGHQLVVACEGVGESNKADRWPAGTLEITGEGDDPQRLATQVKEHEDFHAGDNLAAAADVIGMWDGELEQMRIKDRTFAAGTAAEAEASLYRAAGGTPDAIAARVTDQWMKRSDAYHKMEQGKTTVHDPVIDDGVRCVRLRITQP
jgi:hypothetical protein